MRTATLKSTMVPQGSLRIPIGGSRAAQPQTTCRSCRRNCRIYDASARVGTLPKRPQSGSYLRLYPRHPGRKALLSCSAAAGDVASSDSYLDGVSAENLPALVVFDLDNTVWTPELFQMRKAPKAWKNIRLFEGAHAALNELSDSSEWSCVQVAAASRANKVKEAHRLLSDFKLDNGMSLDDLFVVSEVYPGSKKKHFGQLRSKTGIPYNRMIFFDDYIGNCTEVSELGVMCVKVNHGLDYTTWQLAIKAYATMMANDLYMGQTVSQGDLQNMAGLTGGAISDGSADQNGKEKAATKSKTSMAAEATVGEAVGAAGAGGRESGTIKWYRSEKGYGFIQRDNGSGDVFVGSRSLGSIPEGMMQPGAQVTFSRMQQGNGKEYAASLELVGSSNMSTQASNSSSSMYPCFSMAQPFAALLVNGAKTLESRKGPMLADFEGQKVALHVGRRDWQGLDKHAEILRQRGLDDGTIKSLSRLPPGAKKGDIVALLTLGKTWAPSPKERTSASLRDRVLAPEEGIGKYVTEVTDVEVLATPVREKGQPGVWDCSLPDDSFHQQ